MFAAVCTLLRTTAEPQVVVVDDAHNLDRASIRALLFTARRLHGSRTAMLFGVRDALLDTADLPELRIDGLDEEAAARLLPDLAPATRAVLVRATGGNPLALRELEPDRAVLDALATGTVPLGEALRAAFAERVAALTQPEQDALLVAAASTGRPETISAACAELGLPTKNIPGFTHPLMRSAAYGTASPERRRTVHKALSTVETGGAVRLHRALATEGADEALAAELEADAAACTARGGLAASISVLTEAARLSGTQPARQRRRAAASYAAWKSGHPELVEREHVSTRLRGLMERYSGDQVTAFEYLSRASKSLWDNDPQQAADLAFLAGDAAVQAGLLDEATAAVTEVAERATDSGYRDFGRWLAVWGADAPPPWQVFDAAPEAIKRSGAHKWLVPMAISMRGPYLRQAREFGLEAVADLRENGMLAINAVPLGWLSEMEFRLGLWDEGAAHAHESLHAAKDAGQRPGEANAHALLALFAAGRGEERECRAHASSALEAARAVRDRLAAARATWALALLDEALGQHEAATERLATVEHELVVRQAQDSPFDRARVALARGQQLRRDRRVKDAREPLRQAVELFDGLRATPWAERARAELRACGAPTGAAGTELTPQEWEVARLAAAGLSNREIGERLFLSPRTVGYHLHKVFPKLGVARRSQLRAAITRTE
ncbi:LuxR C-terminal-related transcriptional regulator [Allokutzneria sp. NRRL B-24872]|uniref:helix-turn-helix transcriptional regulator n=1 Tax=Allokutzneria sp. NRRL B-24872 TaxID=1137961 RepID=UPI000A36DB32|nr:LuxR C-terminal-related transcriptional regulator [Allokutzneria sp. NRRL B-24872]